MNRLLFLFLSKLCLVLSVKSDNTTGATFPHTTSMNTTENPVLMLTNDSSTTAEYTQSPSKPTPTITSREGNAYSESTYGENYTSANTSPPPNPTTDGRAVTWVGTLIFLICISIVLLVALFRWYSRNPEQRSLRGLRTSVVESARLAWASAAMRIRQPQKQPGDEEAAEEVVGVGGGGEAVEKDTAGEKDRLRGTEDEEEDDSSDDYSSMESGNVVESARKEEGEERRKMEEDHKEGEDMSPILLGDENTDTEDEEDVTPL